MIVKRILLRQTLTRMEAEASPAKKRAIEAVLGNRRALRALNERVDELADARVGVAAFGDGQLLKWLWERREEILAFVLRIMDLFK